MALPLHRKSLLDLSVWTIAVALLPALGCYAQTQVYILAGQSNMGGRASLRHLQQLLDDPATAPTYQYLQDPQTGEWVVRDDVYCRHNDDRGEGPLRAGFGEPQDVHFGPELQFGFAMGDEIQNDPVYLVKAAWGGASLYASFRPPSSGEPPVAHVMPCADDTPDGCDHGWAYQEMLRVIDHAIGNITHVPGYDESKGFEIAGFLWFHGFQDVLSDDSLFEYGYNLANLIRDVRIDLGLPDLKFYIGELGMGGIDPRHPEHRVMREAQRNVTEMEEFAGTVFYVVTSIYTVQNPSEQEDSFDVDGGGAFHYHGRADTMIGIGQGFADVVLGREQPYPTAIPSIAPSSLPTASPSDAPSLTPSIATDEPTESPQPSPVPTSMPTFPITDQPSFAPSESPIPSPAPSSMPTRTLFPSKSPTLFPTESPMPSPVPSNPPTLSVSPSSQPSESPQPSPSPSSMPTESPSQRPTHVPSSSTSPSALPTESPQPSPSPSQPPTGSTSPSLTPTESPQPSPGPSQPPTGSTSPSLTPTESPQPSPGPTQPPTGSTTPSSNPSVSAAPSLSPTGRPSETLIPSSLPTRSPSIGPTLTRKPSEVPSIVPSLTAVPSILPSAPPSESVAPTATASDYPSMTPSTAQPSVSPSLSLAPSNSVAPSTSTPSASPTWSALVLSNDPPPTETSPPRVASVDFSGAPPESLAYHRQHSWLAVIFGLVLPMLWLR